MVSTIAQKPFYTGGNAGLHGKCVLPIGYWLHVQRNVSEKIYLFGLVIKASMTCSTSSRVVWLVHPPVYSLVYLVHETVGTLILMNAERALDCCDKLVIVHTTRSQPFGCYIVYVGMASPEKGWKKDHRSNGTCWTRLPFGPTNIHLKKVRSLSLTLYFLSKLFYSSSCRASKDLAAGSRYFLD